MYDDEDDDEKAREENEKRSMKKKNWGDMLKELGQCVDDNDEKEYETRLSRQ